MYPLYTKITLLKPFLGQCFFFSLSAVLSSQEIFFRVSFLCHLLGQLFVSTGVAIKWSGKEERSRKDTAALVVIRNARAQKMLRASSQARALIGMFSWSSRFTP